uniref:Uncharacterized protein n=1 Tax=Cucumis melo subsp. melo TaxID=412675 RepID=E5GB96_CUCME|nr:hypothetical protein [Cucumis melo subsp. melo]
MDRSDMLQLQQQVSLAKSVRHRCNEWLVCLFVIFDHPFS